MLPILCLLLAGATLRGEVPHGQLRALAPGWIAIDWEHPADGANAIIIERESPANTWVIHDLVGSITDMGLQANTVYRYRICAVYGDRRDCTPWLEQRTLNTPSANAPRDVPVIVGTSPTTSSISLSWSSSHQYTKYNIRWAKEGDNDEQKEMNGNSHNLTIPGLAPGKYHFIIQGCDYSLFGSNCSPYSAPIFVNTYVPQVPPVPPPPPAVKGVIYRLSLNNDLLWYRHLGHDNGAATWADGANGGKEVGRGWDFKRVFAGEMGIVYAITYEGDLMWWRHDGWQDGTFRWGFDKAKKIGHGWQDFKQVFYGGNGVIYAINKTGDLLWYRHEGLLDGREQWSNGSGTIINRGWGNYSKVFSGGNGVLYAIAGNGDLLWFKYLGWNDLSNRWASNSGQPVGNGWGGMQQVFSGGDNIIYAIAPSGDLLWYQHLGKDDGSKRWGAGTGKKIGDGWFKYNVVQIFYMLPNH